MRHPDNVFICFLFGLIYSSNILADIPWGRDHKSQLVTQDFKSLFLNLGASGGFIAQPYIKFNDISPVDGYPESVTVKFNIYEVGTKNLVYSTPPRKAPTPDISRCIEFEKIPSNIALYPYGGEINYFVHRHSGQSATPSNRLSIAVNLFLNCYYDSSGSKPFRSGLVYSSDLSGVLPEESVGPTWIRSWQGRSIEGLSDIDVDNDSLGDILMVTAGGPTSAGWTHIHVYADGISGVINSNITTSSGASYTLPASGNAYVLTPP